MKRLMCLSCLLFSVCLILQGGIIHHKMDFAVSDISFSEVSLADSIKTVITWGDRNVGYRPLLEEGKEWRYTMYHTNLIYPKKDDEECWMRLGVAREIEGKMYYPVEWFYNGVKTDYDYGVDGGLCLWEDCEAKEVYVSVINQNDEVEVSGLLYDFKNPGNSSADAFFTTCGLAYECYEYSGYDSESREAFHVGGGKNDSVEYLLVEGLGFVTFPDLEEYPDLHCFGTLISGPLPVAVGESIDPKVYEIVDGSGEVLYYLHSARPMPASVDAAVGDQTSIEISESSVVVNSDGPIGRLTVYTATGAVVRSYELRDSHFEMSVRDFAPGCYIVSTPASSGKFIIGR